ncbi:hypothetical protein QBC46DRAFT_426439 [Diplogelasinospora grovesii]|uniref:Nucleoside phosphorylase domain-containing protein n=1 Tax=Diplogelasinospora grovesii TaxID=303347 RepID=A0AAN6NC94_9PEZI|nr:hypothetical protein QBC46DRAFT_426439 [Diplogelasinospora grovesii]
MSDPEHYTIGWICALSTERVAAEVFLDERHDGPKSISPNDNNDYTLGRIGKHNVVIAVLPDGEYGTSSSASVARDMLHSFRNIRIGLMVGIGGGAPSSKHDIRLGDIVVSAPRDGKGGVVQYDFGKTVQGQGFQPTGFLNQPPSVLRTAVSGLRAHYESEGHKLNESVNHILEKKPRLQKKYKRPDPDTDRLYQSGVIHVRNDGASCAAFCGDDASKLIARPERTEHDDNPAIHYGLIASGNQLMKDAVIRDKLVEERGMLCFEMEAAGLMNHFPCLVIRGVCDYSDSHKNKQWQGYAAMVAAAYAKDLLVRIAPNRVVDENLRIIDLLSSVQENVSTIRAKLDRKEDTEILDWLTHIDYGLQQSDYRDKREQGTGQWLLESREFQEWVATSKQTLFCPGIPGAGKTILTSLVVDHLTSSPHPSETGIAYIYCNFNRQHEQSYSSLLASVKELHDQHKLKRTRPSPDDISRVLQSVVETYSKVFIVIDALDECQTAGGCLTRFLSELFHFQAGYDINIFATSRDIPEIARHFENSLRLEIRASTEDVSRYIQGHLHDLPKVIRENQQRQAEITASILEATNGMFLLATLCIESLNDKLTLNAVRSTLSGIQDRSSASGSTRNEAQVIDRAYDQVMERIEKQQPGHKDLALQVLSWIACAKRALSPRELQHALAVEVGMPSLDDDNIHEMEDIVSYLERTKDRWIPEAESTIRRSCVTYLSFKAFEAGACHGRDGPRERMKSYPFYNYAAQDWGHHARQSTFDHEVVNFMESQMKVEASLQALSHHVRSLAQTSLGQGCKECQYRPLYPECTFGFNELHLAAYFGILWAAEYFVERGNSVDAKNSNGRSPLWLAAENGHESIVKLLLATAGVEPNSEDSNNQTPLSFVAHQGNESIVKLLLATNGVDVNAGHGKPLACAAMNGHEAIVQLLLSTGKVDVNSKNSMRQTPLSLAAENGHEAIVQLLLATGKVDVNSKNSMRQTPLSLAAENGHEAVVQLLLATGDVDVHSKDYEGWTPLLTAAGRGHEAVVKLLLATGKVDVNLKDPAGRTPLWYAAHRHPRAAYQGTVDLLRASGGISVGLDCSGCLWCRSENTSRILPRKRRRSDS